MAAENEILQSLALLNEGPPVSREELRESLARLLSERQSQPVHAAVCGKSGAGKSTIINTFRGIDMPDRGYRNEPHDPLRAAQVDVVECTQEATMYQHPRFPNVCFWDLPGCGTPNHPSRNYTERERLHTFDFFLIVTADRFHEDDLELLRHIRSLGKPVFLVRNKFDEAVHAEARRPANRGRPRTEVAAETRAIIIANIQEQLVAHGVECPRVWCVSGLLENLESFDVPELIEQILTQLPALKHNAFLLSMSSRTESMIERKAQVLLNEVYLVSAASALAAAVPIPGVGVAADLALIVAFSSRCAAAFELIDFQRPEMSPSTLSRVSQAMKTSLQLLSVGGITALLSGFVAESALESVASLIPVIGSIIAASLSFAMTTWICRQIVHSHKECALEVVRALREGAETSSRSIEGQLPVPHADEDEEEE